MEAILFTPSQRDLLNIANMAFGVVQAFRKNLPDDDLPENLNWLEHALQVSFPKGDPFVSRQVTEAN
jgi:hypothetical protein